MKKFKNREKMDSTTKTHNDRTVLCVYAGSLLKKGCRKTDKRMGTRLCKVGTDTSSKPGSVQEEQDNIDVILTYRKKVIINILARRSNNKK